MTGSFVRNSMVNAVAGACVTLGGFTSSVVVARLLGVAGTGIMAYAAWSVTVAIIVADVGMPGALSRFLPELRAREGEAAAGGLTRMLLVPFLWSTGGVGVLFGLYAVVQWRLHGVAEPWILKPDTFQASPVFWGLVALSCVTQSLASFAGGYLQGLQRFSDFARLALIGSVVQIGATTGGAIAFGVAGALGGAALGALVPAWALLTAQTAGPPVDAGLRRRVIRYTLETWGGYMVAAFFATRMEVFFLERSWGNHAVGLFTVSLTLSNLATQGPLLLTGALLPQLSHHLGRGEEDIARALYPTSLRLMALIVFPACFGTAAIAPVLLPAIYGGAFADALPSATILVAGAAVIAGTSIAGAYASASDRTRFGLLLGLVGAVLSITSGLTVVPLFGPVGAACSRVGVQCLISGATLVYVYRKIGCRVPAGDILRLAVSAICCGVAARLVVTMQSGVLGGALAIAAGAVTYGTALRLLAPLPPEDVARLRSAVSALPLGLRPVFIVGLRFITAQ